MNDAYQVKDAHVAERRLCRAGMDYLVRMISTSTGFRVDHGCLPNLKSWDFPTYDEANDMYKSIIDLRLDQGFKDKPLEGEEDLSEEAFAEGLKGGLESGKVKESMTVMIQERHLRKGDVECHLSFFEEGVEYVIDVQYGVVQKVELFRTTKREQAFQYFNGFIEGKKEGGFLESEWPPHAVMQTIKIPPDMNPPSSKRKIRWKD